MEPVPCDCVNSCIRTVVVTSCFEGTQIDRICNSGIWACLKRRKQVDLAPRVFDHSTLHNGVLMHLNARV